MRAQLIATLAGALSLPCTAIAIDIASCGQTVPRRATGVLQTDLECDGPAVSLERRATLDTNGHTITASSGSAVLCLERKCTVTSPELSPGTIAGTAAAVRGIAGADGRTVVENSIVNGFGFAGVTGGRVLILRNVTATNNEIGILGTKLIAENVTASNNVNGIGASRVIRAQNLTANNNQQWGVDAGRRIVGTNVTVKDNGFVGIDTSAGVNERGGAPKLKDSEITGNPIDLLSKKRPRLENTSCGLSQNSDDGTTWGVCTND